MKTTHYFGNKNPLTLIKRTLELLFDSYFEKPYAENKVNSTTSSEM
ncbi:hypothetical protein ACQKOF_02775 [Lysinibacillus sp. NPDC093190]